MNKFNILTSSPKGWQKEKKKSSKKRKEKHYYYGYIYLWRN